MTTDTDRHAQARACLEQAWELCYLDAARARELGRRAIALVQHDPQSAEAAWGWWHVALAEARCGQADVAREAVQHARGLFERLPSVRGLRLADEVQAILLRRGGDLAGCDELHHRIDAGDAAHDHDFDRFLAHNSRAINAKLLGRAEDALRHFYRGHAAAVRTGWVGPRLLALGNLGGFHQDLFNLDDARALTREAFDAARAVGARQALAGACGNLIVIHFAAGQPDQARELTDFVIAHESELPPDSIERLRVALALGCFASGDLDEAQRFLDAGPAASVGDGEGRAFWSWVQAGVWLARRQDGDARDLVRRALDDHEAGRTDAQPFDLMQLHRMAAQAHERLGDLAAALASTRQAHATYDHLVGRSARARYIALEVAHEVDAARHARDRAEHARQTAENDRHRLEALNQQLQAQIEQTQRLQAQLQEQALRDPLTGLHNRRYLFEVAPRLLELAQRQRSPVCLALIDLDHFKALNDGFGHQAGDEALQAFASLMQQRLRRSEVLSRHGGEEFVVVMPDAVIDDACSVLARLLEGARALALVHRGRSLPPLSFSAGLAQFPRHGQTLDQLLSRADRALYRAKDRGRGCVEVAVVTEFAPISP